MLNGREAMTLSLIFPALMAKEKQMILNTYATSSQRVLPLQSTAYFVLYKTKTLELTNTSSKRNPLPICKVKELVFLYHKWVGTRVHKKDNYGLSPLKSPLSVVMNCYQACGERRLPTSKYFEFSDDHSLRQNKRLS